MKSSDQLSDFLVATLACIQSGCDYLEQRCHDILSWLIEMKYITMETRDGSRCTYCITPLGNATLKGTVLMIPSACMGTYMYLGVVACPGYIFEHAP